MTGKNTQNKNNKGGRPTDKTADTVTKLIAAFHNGFNDTEACYYAQIARKTYYDWLNKDEEFSNKITYAKMHPNIKAKELVISNINEGDVKSAKWWLERRAKDEFSTKQEHKFDPGAPMIQIDIFGEAIKKKEQEENDNKVQPETEEPTAIS